MDKEKDFQASEGDDKKKQLNPYHKKNTGPDKEMTSDTGFKISNDRWSLRAGKRGPLLSQDIHFYRKQSRFNRERIPEKVVHARGFGVYGDFELTKSMKEYTVADFLQEPGTVTPVFNRFSNFIGNKGSKDTAVDIRGFATKFYTQEGNYDMLALQFPVFIISDAIKFMDVTHAAKPNQKTHIPQATVAHDRFWDYVANNQESAHMVMWLMSQRGRPRSWRMMEGYPINTFRFINKEGKSTFVRFVWKPKLGVHSLLMEEANLIGGIDPDFHRRDIIEAIEKGAYPEYDLGVQLIPEEDEFEYDFDVLDSTKLWPEEVIPVEIIGKMTLNRLTDNFFAEEEQAAFDPSTLIPGIGFTNDPVLQGRAFAYRDTEYYRQHTGNINEIPINQPLSEVNTNFRDSYSRYSIDEDLVTHHENSLAENSPKEVSPEDGGYTHYPEKVEGYLTREAPSESFLDYFSQARLFWNSLADFERKDLIDTFTYHLQYVESQSIREQNVEMWANVDNDFASELADRLGVQRPTTTQVDETRKSPALSMANMPSSAATQKVGVLIGNDFDGQEVNQVLEKLKEQGAFVHIVSENLGTLTGNDGTELQVQETFKTKHPVLYDALYIVGGKAKDQEKFNQYLMEFYYDTYKFFKPIGIAQDGEIQLEVSKGENPLGVVYAKASSDFAEEFVQAIAKKRFWNRK